MLWTAEFGSESCSASLRYGQDAADQFRDALGAAIRGRGQRLSFEEWVSIVFSNIRCQEKLATRQIWNSEVLLLLMLLDGSYVAGGTSL